MVDGVVNRCFLCVRPLTNRECAHPSLGLDDSQDPDHVANEDVEGKHHVEEGFHSFVCSSRSSCSVHSALSSQVHKDFF